MKVSGAGEFNLLDVVKPYLDMQAGADDAAVLAVAGGLLVASCDTFVEGVHFDLGWMSAEDAGWRALALALGDLAAKGATPGWALTSLAMPVTWEVGHLEGLFRGMAGMARLAHMEIVGGDMSVVDGPAVLSVTVAGRCDKRPIQRAEAQPGWTVAVTGPLGASALALGERRALRLEPRLAEGRALNGIGLCCGDVSDGLVREMEKFRYMSGAGCVLRAGDVPVAPGASLEGALTGGEEAELVCVGPDELIRGSGLAVVGTLTALGRVEVIDAEGRPISLTRGGYDHFA
ncbi:MAG: thiamine-monophosphate kinase [Candidatus Dormibacterales bacterium]